MKYYKLDWGSHKEDKLIPGMDGVTVENKDSFFNPHCSHGGVKFSFSVASFFLSLDLCTTDFLLVNGRSL